MTGAKGILLPKDSRGAGQPDSVWRYQIPGLAFRHSLGKLGRPCGILAIPCLPDWTSLPLAWEERAGNKTKGWQQAYL